MDGATVSVLSLEQLITALLLIVKVIQGIVAIHIGIGVMDNSMDEWSLVQSVEG